MDALAKAYVDEQNTPGMKLTIPTEWYAAVLQSHDAFAAALERLERGDRRCLRLPGRTRPFQPGASQRGVVAKHVLWLARRPKRVRAGRFTALARHRKGHARLSGSPRDIGVVLQQRMIHEPAPVDEMGEYLSYPESSLIKHLASQSELPGVPTAAQEIPFPRAR